MDVVHGLLRTVVRGFYDLRAIIILDAVLTHHVLSDRELVTATGIPIKDVRATCARLREDHLLKEVSHKEENGPGMRAYTQTVYYVHFTEAVDAIKWKMHVVESQLKEELDHRHNAQDYVCDVCGSHFETIDALSLFDPTSQQFLCQTCGNPLREDDSNSRGANEANHMDNQMEGFMKQLQPLISALKRIDELTIPENTLETELQQHVPLIGVENQGPAAYNLPAHLAGAAARDRDQDKTGITIAGSADSRLPQQVESTFQVNITSESEQQALRESALAEKKRLSEENALPEWHSRSTVSTTLQNATQPRNQSTEESSTAGTAASSAAADGGTDDKSASAPGEKKDADAEDAMDAYFKSLQAQQQDNEEEEEDEDEFEDIM